MTTVVVARHGETAWNRAGRYQGRRESALSDLGRRQAQALARALGTEPIARIVSSPLQRCVATAQPLAEQRGIALETDADLLEIDHGSWEGRLRAEVARDDGARLAAWAAAPASVRFPGGESLAEVAARWAAFARALDADATVVVVTHDVVVRVALLAATGGPLGDLWSVPAVNGGYARLAVERGVWRVLAPCVDAHLEGLRADLRRQAL